MPCARAQWLFLGQNVLASACDFFAQGHKGGLVNVVFVQGARFSCAWAHGFCSVRNGTIDCCTRVQAFFVGNVMGSPRFKRPWLWLYLHPSWGFPCKSLLSRHSLIVIIFAGDCACGLSIWIKHLRELWILDAKCLSDFYYAWSLFVCCNFQTKTLLWFFVSFFKSLFLLENHLFFFCNFIFGITGLLPLSIVYCLLLFFSDCITGKYYWKLKPLDVANSSIL